MKLRRDARTLALGLILPAMAGCATTAPVGPTVVQGGDQGGMVAQDQAQVPETQVPDQAQAQTVDQGQQQVQGGAQPMHGYGGQPPAQIPAAGAGAFLKPLDYVTSHPVLDYSWYANRGNFATFGWAPGFQAACANAMYYNTGSAWAPYTYNAQNQCYEPYTTNVGGQVAYPYFGYGGSPYYGFGVPYFGLGLGSTFSFRRFRGTDRRGSFTGRRGAFGRRGR